MRRLTAWEIRDFAVTTLGLFALYLFAYFLVWAAIMPVQRRFAPDISPFACLLYLPHGIRVFATSLVGARSIPGLLLAEFVGNYIFWNLSGWPQLVFVSLASGSSKSSACASSGSSPYSA